MTCHFGKDMSKHMDVRDPKNNGKISSVLRDPIVLLP